MNRREKTNSLRKLGAEQNHRQQVAPNTPVTKNVHDLSVHLGDKQTSGKPTLWVPGLRLTALEGRDMRCLVHIDAVIFCGVWCTMMLLYLVVFGAQ
ncbi:hypothetical protein ACROYT_G028749 [Oculina patagonica]